MHIISSSIPLSNIIEYNTIQYYSIQHNTVEYNAVQYLGMVSQQRPIGPSTHHAAEHSTQRRQQEILGGSARRTLLLHTTSPERLGARQVPPLGLGEYFLKNRAVFELLVLNQQAGRLPLQRTKPQQNPHTAICRKFSVTASAFGMTPTMI